jgi:hypothetical protein
VNIRLWGPNFELPAKTTKPPTFQLQHFSSPKPQQNHTPYSIFHFEQGTTTSGTIKEPPNYTVTRRLGSIYTFHSKGVLSLFNSGSEKPKRLEL